MEVPSSSKKERPGAPLWNSVDVLFIGCIPRLFEVSTIALSQCQTDLSESELMGVRVKFLVLLTVLMTGCNEAAVHDGPATPADVEAAEREQAAAEQAERAEMQQAAKRTRPR